MTTYFVTHSLRDNVSQELLLTGLQGLNRLLDKAEETKHGKSVVVNAHSHDYKSVLPQIDAIIVPCTRPGEIKSGDVVVGQLSYAEAAEVCAAGAKFYNTELVFNPDGVEMNLVEYSVKKM